MGQENVELSISTCAVPAAEALDRNLQQKSPKRSPRSLAQNHETEFCYAAHTNNGTSMSSSTSSLAFFKKFGAEFIGTFILIFAAAGSAILDKKTNGNVTYIGVAAAPGLAVMAVILSTGHISGAHLNPSVTIAFAALKEFPWIQVPFYFAAQVCGSVCASFTLKFIFQTDHSAGVTVPSGSVLRALVMEFIVTFSLMFVVTAVATDTRAVGELAGIAVGATVTMNNILAGSISGSSMNPARTLGPAIACNDYRAIWVYIVGPTLGTLAGAAAYTIVRLNENESDVSSTRVRSFSR